TCFEKCLYEYLLCFFFQAEDGIRDRNVTGVQTCALPILLILLSPPIMGDGAIFPLTNPGLVSIPLGFLAGIIVSLMTKPEDNDKIFAEMSVRSHTGLGAEK